ncbi:MAG: dethiobiotin synthase [Proteobacteria bacterium]|nr:dethiobiotin synthase [Pseudomonadota bacterium]
MKPLFITATGTGIGKTIVTTALAWQARQAGRAVRVLKPVISGFTSDTYADSDTALILRSLEADETPDAIEAVSPWRFKAPLAPDMAAAREGKALDFNHLVKFCTQAPPASTQKPEDLLLIEGVGGLMVPLTETDTVLDWIKALNYPAVLVAGSYLGTISHTLTAMETARAHAIDIAAIVVSESVESPVPLDETRNAIARFLPETPVLTLPRLPAGQAPWRHAPDLLTQLT